MRIIGIDPGLASLGCAVLDVVPGAPPALLSLSVYTTQKADKRRHLRAAEDESDRARELYRRLRSVVAVYRPEILAVEACAFPFGRSRFSVVSALGRVRGLIDALVEDNRLALVELTAQEVKRLAAGSKSATKDEVVCAVERLLPDAEWPPQRTLVEHAADAAAVAWCALQSEPAKALLRREEQEAAHVP